MTRIRRPDEELDFHLMSKRELAHLVNQQSDQLQTSERQRAMLFRVLVAITRDPAIVRVVDRYVAAVERSAVEAVDLASTRLNTHLRDGYLELVAIDEPPRLPSPILTPKVVWR